MLSRFRGTLRELRPSSRPDFLMMPSWFATEAVDNLLFVISALEHHGFKPVAHKGLLLGALRLEGLLPWDDDADAFLLDTSTQELDSRFAEVCREHGFTLRFRHQHGYFFAFPATLLPFAHAGLTELGLLTRTEAADGAHFDAHEPGRHLSERELLPFRRIPFYGSWLPGPAEPEVAMERMYGAIAAPSVMSRFRAPALSDEAYDFWRSARPLTGQPDWPRISARFRARARNPLFQLRQLLGAGWHFLNRGHWLATDFLRAMAGGNRE
jgi:hypothetical protein